MPTHIPWSPTQVKVRCKLSIQRCRTLVEKNEAQAKRARREVAALLENGKIETARLRTEALILQDMHNELLELIELYLELILARFGLLEVTSSTSSKEPDEGVREAISSIVYASPRTDIRELHIVREAFMQRYGRDWAIAVMDHQSNVSTRVMSKCTTTTPDQAWVDMYLYEIAKAYQVDWKPEGVLDLDRVNGEMDTAAQDANLRTTTLAPPEYDARDDPPGGSVLLPTAPSDAPHLVDIRSSTSHIPIVRASTPTNSGTNTPSTSTAALPAPPPTDPNQADHTIVIKATKPGQSTAQAQKAESNKQNAEEDSRFDNLAARFAALKRK